MEKIIFSIILTVFPILIYLVFSCYNSLNNVMIKKMVFIITMYTSLYLNLTLNSSREILLFCNIPIIICYLKKEELIALLLSLIVILYSYILYDINIYILFGKYLCYFILYLLIYNQRGFTLLFIKISALIQGVFVCVENTFDETISLSVYILLIYGLTFLVLYLFKLADDISNLYVTYGKMVNENKIKDSLFKLTHEIKNPIAVCKGYLDMINLEDSVNSLKYVNIIKSEIDRSLNVISEFMDFNKIKIDKDIMDIVMLMDEVYDSFSLLVMDKNIKFVYDNAYDEIYLMGDYDRLKQVFVNIIKNSIESIDSTGTISININKYEEEVVVTIIDSGVGMNKEELDNIKQMFFTTKKSGTGLGVALSNEIVVAHDGILIYESEKNKGTRCVVRLPM